MTITRSYWRSLCAELVRTHHRFMPRDVKPEMLGHYVEVQGIMTGGLDWYIEPKSIREVGE